MAIAYMSEWTIERCELALGWTTQQSSANAVNAARLRKHLMDTGKVKSASPFGDDNDREGLRFRWTITFIDECDIRSQRRRDVLELCIKKVLESVLFGTATIDAHGVITPAAPARPISAQVA